jgi:glycosyltransferase involved in cell wall biosynthesis
MAGTKDHMKVLMTADTVGGVWTYCMDLCKALQRSSVEIHLVTMGEKMKGWQKDEVAALENVAVYETAFRLEWMQDPWNDIAACGQWLLQLERKLQPDLIHLNCFAYGSLPFLAPVMVVAHSDVFSWFFAVKGEEPSGEWNCYFSCVQKGLQGAEMVIAPSGALLGAVQSIYGLQIGEVIYNGRDRNLFASGEKQLSVFSMGRIWDEAKNTKLLVDAAALMEAPVRIAGDNSFAQSSFDTAGTSNVEFLGKLSTRQIAAQLANASIYVLPAKYEPFGLSVLEAALSGCALVLGDIPSLREIWKDSALYVDTNDSVALAQTINHLLHDQELLQEMQEKAKDRAAHYSLERLAENYSAIYQQLIRQTIKQQKQETI